MDSFLTPYDFSNSGLEKLQFTPFWGSPKPGCSNCLCTGTIESHYFFVLGRILAKFHIRTRLIESFPMVFRTWWCGEEKLHFTLQQPHGRYSSARLLHTNRSSALGAIQCAWRNYLKHAREIHGRTNSAFVHTICVPSHTINQLLDPTQGR